MSSMMETQKQSIQAITALCNAHLEQDEKKNLAWAFAMESLSKQFDLIHSFLSLLKLIIFGQYPLEFFINLKYFYMDFTSSESKMIAVLTSAGFEMDRDIISVTSTENETEVENYFITYASFKAFIMNGDNAERRNVLIMGETLFSIFMGKISKTILNRMVSSKMTHFAIIIAYDTDFDKNAPTQLAKIRSEKKEIVLNLADKMKPSALISKMLETFKPKSFVQIIKGSKAHVKSVLKSVNDDDIIIPLAKAQLLDANADIERILGYVKKDLTTPYRTSVKADIASFNKDINEKNKTARLKTPRQEIPKSDLTWGYTINKSMIALNPKIETLSFDIDDIAKCIKQNYLNTLAGKHVSMNKLTSQKYLDLVEQLVQELDEKEEYNSAEKGFVFTKLLEKASKRDKIKYLETFIIEDPKKKVAGKTVQSASPKVAKTEMPKNDCETTDGEGGSKPSAVKVAKAAKATKKVSEEKRRVIKNPDDHALTMKSESDNDDDDDDDDNEDEDGDDNEDDNDSDGKEDEPESELEEKPKTKTTSKGKSKSTSKGKGKSKA